VSVNPRYTDAMAQTTTSPKVYTLAVRKAAAKVAVTASKKTGRPVHPRVAKLAAS